MKQRFSKKILKEGIRASEEGLTIRYLDSMNPNTSVGKYEIKLPPETMVENKLKNKTKKFKESVDPERIKNKVVDIVLEHYRNYWECAEENNPFEFGTECYNYIDGLQKELLLGYPKDIRVATRMAVKDALKDYYESIPDVPSPYNENRVRRNSNKKLKESAPRSVADKVVLYYQNYWEAEPEDNDPFDIDSECWKAIDAKIQKELDVFPPSWPEKPRVIRDVYDALHQYVQKLESGERVRNVRNYTEDRQLKKKRVNESQFGGCNTLIIPPNAMASIQQYVLGYYEENWEGVNPYDLECQRDLEREAEDRALEKGFDYEEEDVMNDLENFALDSVFEYYRTNYSTSSSIWD